MKNSRVLRAEKAELVDQMNDMIHVAESQHREFTPVEERRWNDLKSRVERMSDEIERLENGGRLPSYQHGTWSVRTNLGDEERAFCHYARTGDRSGLRDLRVASDGEYAFEVRLPRLGELRAVNSIMNITTAADGGAAVPTGFAGQIALRMSEYRLAERLGVRRVPGQGTTVNFPYENADPSVFAQTAEQDDAYAQVYERDVAPVLNTKAFTLVKYTKKLALTEELLDDEDAGLMASISDTIGRAMGLTHNSLLLTEVAANGTSLKTFASATVIADGELEQIAFNDTIGHYLYDPNSVSWVMRPSTYGEIAALRGDERLYTGYAMGPKELLEYPVHWSSYAGLTAATAKSVYFGNWYMVGMREDPALRLIRDPYTTDGIVYLKYAFRAVYGVLVAPGIGYGVHPSA